MNTWTVIRPKRKGEPKRRGSRGQRRGARRRNQSWLDRQRFPPGWNGSRQTFGDPIWVCGVFLPKGREAGTWRGTLEMQRGDGVILWKAEINKAKSLEIRQEP